MSALPRLGVVVLNWNGKPHLERLLPTLQASDHPNWFAIVVDNGSTDDSVTWIDQHHPWVDVVETGANLRFAGGNNRGAEAALAAGAEMILLLNNDTEVEPSTLRHLTAALDENPTVGIAGPQIRYLDRPQRIWYGGGQFFAPLGWVGHRGLRRAVDAGSDPAGPTDWVTGCAMLVRRETWEAVGGLDEEFYIYAEDVDFCRRAQALGWGCLYTPEAWLRHAVSASTGGEESAFKAYHKSRSRRQLLRRHGGAWGPVALLSALGQDLVLSANDLVSGRPAAARGRLQAWGDSFGSGNRYPAA